MKIIHSLSDIELLKENQEISLKLVKEIKQDFLNMYEADHDVADLLNYRLSSQQALIVLEKGDDVMAKLNNPFALEYVERIDSGEVAYYRCALRNVHDIQLYYSLVNTHDEVTEAWLHEQAEWDNNLFHSND